MICDLCGSEMTERRDCLNASCVQSARLTDAHEVVSGTFHVDGTETARHADGSYSGTMRVKVDDTFAREIRQWFERLPEADTQGGS